MLAFLSRHFRQKRLDKALLKASEQGRSTEVERLLREGASPNAHNGYDCALSIAGRSPDGNVETVRLLLNAGAKIHGPLPKSTGITPTLRAAHASDSAIMRLLIAHGGDLNALQRRSPGQSAFQQLCHWADEDLLEFALDHGADVNARASVRNRGRTALHFIGCSGRLDRVKWLIMHGADPEKRDLDDKQPLDCVIELLQDANYVWGRDPFYRSKLEEVRRFLIEEDRVAS